MPIPILPDTIHKFKNFGIVIEFHARDLADERLSLLGVVTMALKPFASLFAIENSTVTFYNETLELPSIAFQGIVDVSNPLSGEYVADCKIALSIGTSSQVASANKSVIPSASPSKQPSNATTPEKIIEIKAETPPKQQTAIRPTTPLQDANVQTSIVVPLQTDPILILPSPQQAVQSISKSQEDLDDILLLTEQLNGKPLPQNNVDTDDSELSMISHHEPEMIRVLPKPPTSTFDHKLLLSHPSSITIKIHRASGLQASALHLLEKHPKLHSACEFGVNPFAEYRLLPDDFDEPDLLIQNHTKVAAATFCPVWQFERVVTFQLYESIVQHFGNNDALITVYHRFPEHQKGAKYVALGSAVVALLPLSDGNDIHGWFNIYSSGGAVMVGAIEVSIQLDTRTKDYFTGKVEAPAREPVLKVKKADVKPIPHEVCRITMIIEEIIVPQLLLEKASPYSNKHQSIFPCYYF